MGFAPGEHVYYSQGYRVSNSDAKTHSYLSFNSQELDDSRFAEPNGNGREIMNQRFAKVHSMKAAGKTLKEIADALGVEDASYYLYD